MHHAIVRQPITCSEDAITLHDALGRGFILSYVYFKHWEVSFVMVDELPMTANNNSCSKAFFGSNSQMMAFPGRKQVQDGQYVVAKGSMNNLAVTKSNWSEQVFPGSQLSMTVILSMLKLQRGRCPRPSCDYIIANVTGHNNFVTWQVYLSTMLVLSTDIV